MSNVITSNKERVVFYQTKENRKEASCSETIISIITHSHLSLSSPLTFHRKLQPTNAMTEIGQQTPGSENV